MDITITVPDDIIRDLQTAIEKHNARAAAQSMPPIVLTPKQLVMRESKGWVRNFILSEHHQDLSQQTEDLLKAEADRLSGLLSSSSPTGK
jgi:hypothetical protein